MKKKATNLQDFEKIKQEKKILIEKLFSPDRSGALTLNEASEYYEKSKPKRFGPIDMVLLLLGIFPDKPIRGKTMMMKQTFLAEKEFENDVDDLQFVGHRYGPHSFLMENILRNMEFVGLINPKGTSRNPKYYLGEKGELSAKKLIETLSIDEKERLENFRKTYDELGQDGILRYVYENYRDYTDESIIKYRYVSVDWVEKGSKNKR